MLIAIPALVATWASYAIFIAGSAILAAGPVRATLLETLPVKRARL